MINIVVSLPCTAYQYSTFYWQFRVSGRRNQHRAANLHHIKQSFCTESINLPAFSPAPILPRKTLCPVESAGEDVFLLDGILSPGFINAHCHIELSHFKGLIPRHTGLVDFVQQVMTRRGEKMQAEKAAAMYAAAEELYDSGTVAVGDICNTTDSIELKAESPIYWQNFIEVSGFVDATAPARLAATQEVFDAFPGLNKSLVPHAPYSVSETLFKLINDRTAGKLISIHNQEAAAENELYLTKSGAFLELYENFGIDIGSFRAPGTSSLKAWRPYFTKDQRIISVHNSFTTPSEMQWATNLHYCLCINANLYIENRLPPIRELIENECSIVLGTDSYASNDQLNMMAEINSIQQHYPEIPVPKILQWATLNGARALGIEDRFGSFEKGRKPGLVLIKNGSAKRVSV
ncbi:MAG: amidohydrolase [Chitinophagaceae bacterium]|nr:MAG: amidohydrolase [Chitinophagaceae bacterium]